MLRFFILWNLYYLSDEGTITEEVGASLISVMQIPETNFPTGIHWKDYAIYYSEQTPKATACTSGSCGDGAQTDVEKAGKYVRSGQSNPS